MWRFLTNSHRTSLLSPNGRYQTFLGTLREVWGSYLAPLAVWTTKKPREMVYHREGYAAHALAPTDPMPVAVWSTWSQWLSFYKFKRQTCYQLTFISVEQCQVYRIAASELLLQQLPRIAMSHALIAELLQQTGTAAEDLAQDPIEMKELLP